MLKAIQGFVGNTLDKRPIPFAIWSHFWSRERAQTAWSIWDSCDPRTYSTVTFTCPSCIQFDQIHGWLNRRHCRSQDRVAPCERKWLIVLLCVNLSRALGWLREKKLPPSLWRSWNCRHHQIQQRFQPWPKSVGLISAWDCGVWCKPNLQRKTWTCSCSPTCLGIDPLDMGDADHDKSFREHISCHPSILEGTMAVDQHGGEVQGACGCCAPTPQRCCRMVDGFTRWPSQWQVGFLGAPQRQGFMAGNAWILPWWLQSLRTGNCWSERSSRQDHHEDVKPLCHELGFTEGAECQVRIQWVWAGASPTTPDAGGGAGGRGVPLRKPGAAPSRRSARAKLESAAPKSAPKPTGLRPTESAPKPPPMPPPPFFLQGC